MIKQSIISDKYSGSFSPADVSSSDYNEMIEVWERSVRSTHHFLAEDDIVFYRKLILEKYFDLVDLKCIKSLQGSIIAFIGTSESKIEMLFVDPSYRGQGAGKILAQYALHELNSNMVDVNEQNEQAVGFYYALGFTLLKRLPVDNMGKPYPVLQLIYNR